MSQENLDLHGRVSKLEVQVDTQEKRWQSQVEKNDVLTKLATLMEMQMSESKEREKRQEVRDEKQNKQMSKITDTLNNMNENLTGLNSGLQEVKSRVTDIEKQQEDKKIDLGKLFKDIIFKGVPTVVATVVATWLLIQSGLK